MGLALKAGNWRSSSSERSSMSVTGTSVSGRVNVPLLSV